MPYLDITPSRMHSVLVSLSFRIHPFVLRVDRRRFSFFGLIYPSLELGDRSDPDIVGHLLF